MSQNPDLERMLRTTSLTDEGGLRVLLGRIRRHLGLASPEQEIFQRLFIAAEEKLKTQDHNDLALGEALDLANAAGTIAFQFLEQSELTMANKLQNRIRQLIGERLLEEADEEEPRSGPPIRTWVQENVDHVGLWQRVRRALFG